ncbi:hypothetical protein AU252_20260 [Pseudarthrobacter sulfonivorans]|uniref:Uncharacterized protein n=1 Tax=Pseudarthrobacter sulfonivorans TaxID=121292 RepID=A0A0U3QS03_9MICC|nr:hypothetical protein [Pseudarthrobacter sulfonivorans]ALV43204.1 hypothetical protein AU252_20260 [Pseudarthrobacter sulfonivorans]
MKRIGDPELDDGTMTTEVELEALPVLAIIINNAHGEPHAYQKHKVTIGGLRLARWFCTTDQDWPQSSERLLRDGATYSTLWLPKGSLYPTPRP